MEDRISKWKDEINVQQRYPTLDKKIEVDITIIGGGITGVTTAYLLSNEGLRVALIERNQIGSGETGNTTAMITHFFDSYSSKLEKDTNIESTKAYWDAKQLAIEKIQEFVIKENINCDLTKCSSYIYALDDNGIKDLERELEYAEKFSYKLKLEYANMFPFENKGHIEIPDQYKFHPRKYILELIEKAKENGVHVFENTQATDIKEQDDFSIIKTTSGEIHTNKIVLATHYPYSKDPILLGKLTPYNSYVIEVEIAKDIFVEGNYWDTQDPYMYFRIEKGEAIDILIVGGCDHRTGKLEREAPYKDLELYLQDTLGIKEYKLLHTWSGQVIESNDGLPFIGKYKDNKYIATGFWGNGMTFGTFSAILLADIICGRDNQFEKIFAVNRLNKPTAFINEGLENAKDFIVGRLPTFDKDESDTESGQIISEDGKKVAVYKDKNGKTIKISAYCTHMGCIVNWNKTDKTWDCPCHGSRFSTKGKVITGPADKELEEV
jgi:glycine/D-amino acid oxidase-like deaminating enzyme/nitrite reductase/ring-hydroxylating ferredoxin subunit